MEATLVPLGDLVATVMGQAPSSRDCNFEGRGTPFVKAGEFGPRSPVIREWTTNPLKLAQESDVLLCVVGATCGKVNLGANCAIGRSVAAIRPDPNKLDQHFLHYFMMTLIERLRVGSVGAAQTVISKEMIHSIQFPLVPLPEQRRIVAILDEAFEGIATAKANAEKNLQNARELFDSALDAALSSRDSCSIETSLADEVDLLTGYAFSSAGYTRAADGIRLLRGDNIMQGYLRWDDAKRWPSADAASFGRFALQEGDVVLAMDRPWVKAGLKRAQIGPADLPCLQLQRTARLRPRRRMSVDFLYHLTGSSAFSRHLLSVQTGLGVPHISGKQIESFRFMLPSLELQEFMTCKLDDLQRQSERLEEIGQQKLAALDELKKSLLHQAFSGAL